MKYCRKCRQFKHYEDLFGYCRKYETQALITENCKIIKEMIPSTNVKNEPTLKQG